MGLLQDPHFLEGLKSTVRLLLLKIRNVGSIWNVVNKRLIMRKMAILPVVLLFVVTPVYVSASVISFLFSLFSSEEVQAQEVPSNSQKMALLQSEISPISTSTTTEHKLSIIEDSFLSPESSSINADSKSLEDEQISVYVVRDGDTLPAVAKMFGVSVNTIRWANDIKGNTISVGQTLVILPISGIKHIVKKGDTLESIAKHNKGDLNEILQYNNLTRGSKLSIGDIVIVPDGEAARTVVRSSSTGVSSRPTYSGYYMKPIVGGVKSQGLHGHNGIDFAASYGTNILASADGEVIISRSGWNGGYGTYIVVKHGNGTQTLYAHLSASLVSSGQRVSQGQVIGKMGSTGKSTGVHLHFEIRGARNPF